MEHKVIAAVYERVLQTETEYAQSVIRDLPVNRQLFLTLVASPYISEAARARIMQLSPYTTTSDTMISVGILEYLRAQRPVSSGLPTIYEMELFESMELTYGC